MYSVQCEECNSVYVGQTGRSFETRFKEHVRAYRNKNPNVSNFAKHLIECGHKISQDLKPKILHVCKKGKKLHFLESLEINKLAKNDEFQILNDQLDLNNSPLLNLTFKEPST